MLIAAAAFSKIYSQPPVSSPFRGKPTSDAAEEFMAVLSTYFSMRRQLIFRYGLILYFTGQLSFAQSPLTLQQVVAASGFIFSGKVSKVWSARDAATGFIVTHATVAVQDAVRGSNAKYFTFTQYGGSYQGLNVFVADMSYFTAGEEVVVFLYPASTLGLTSPVGVTEGKFTIQHDPITGKKIVAGNPAQAKMLETSFGKALPIPAAESPLVPLMEYDRFLKLVREMAEDNRR